MIKNTPVSRPRRQTNNPTPIMPETQWTPQDQSEALSFGWGVFFQRPHLMIQRNDATGRGAAKFASDGDARDHLLELAFRDTAAIRVAALYSERELGRKAIRHLINHS